MPTKSSKTQDVDPPDQGQTKGSSSGTLLRRWGRNQHRYIRACGVPPDFCQVVTASVHRRDCPQLPFGVHYEVMVIVFGASGADDLIRMASLKKWV